MTFPLIYNLTDLIDKLQDLNILTQLGQLLPQHPGGGDSHMKQTGMLVGNFEFNP